MKNHQYFNSVPDMNATQVVVMNHFDKVLTLCYENWCNGRNELVLPCNLKELYGEAVVGYFQHRLQQCVGAVALTTVEVGNAINTLVQMQKYNVPQPHDQLQVSMHFATETPQQSVVKPKGASFAPKGPPRPMNMWLLYRDAQHKKLKAEDPDLSVQEISSICSESWRKLTLAEKGVWKAIADAGAKEHARLFPNYKYTPRKRGEKKKRLSSKAKQAAAAAATTTVTNTFNVAPVPKVSLAALDTNVDFGTAPGVNPVTAEVESLGDISQSTAPVPFFGLDKKALATDSELHDAESLRQFGLQIELQAALAATNPSVEVMGDTIAFRTGANGDATLPTICADFF